jgi:photosystem II stability/assembly factor-like uncharacterized protein
MMTRPILFSAFAIRVQIMLTIGAISLSNMGCKNQQSLSNDTKDFSNVKSWQVIGPGGGGGVMLPTISPFDDNFVMTHCDMTGGYISYDGGSAWRMFNLLTVPVDFEFDPGDSNTVYVATRGYPHSEDRGSGLSILFRSEDKGKRWRIIYPDVSSIKQEGKLQSEDFFPSQIAAGAFDGSIDKVEVDANDNRRIYLGISPLRSYMGRSAEKDSDSALLVISSNYGENWKPIGRIPGQNVKAIFPGITNDDEVTVFTESACVRINENTGEMATLPLPVDRIIVVKGGQNKSNNIIYIQSAFKRENGALKGGMYISKDGGKTWSQRNEGLLKGIAEDKVPSFQEGLAVCETKPEVAYISITNPATKNAGNIEDIYSIYKTLDAGTTWVPVLLSSTPGGYITKNFEGSWMEQSYDPGWGGSPINLGVAPGNPDICYAGDNGRGYKTTDGGKTWKQVYSQTQPDSSYSNTGLNVTTCYGVHFDPFDNDHFFICYTDIGLFHTFNSGKSWLHSVKGLPREWVNTCYSIEFDPKVRGKVWSAWANAHDLPRTKMFGRGGFANFQGGIAVSEDGGRTWQKCSTGMPENSICTFVLLDSTTPVDSRALYAAVFDKGVYKSIDGGKTWKEANAGLGENLFAWELRRNSEGRLFALFARGQKADQTIGGAIYFSDDNAESWKQLQLPKEINGPHDLLIDPVHSNIMYVSCWPRTVNGKDLGGGIIKTEDGGKTWKQVFDETIRVNSAGMDPKQPNRIFINTFHNAAYKSDDSGETWQRIEGYRFKWGQRAIPDVHHPGMLYLTTYGGSVFYGPADGVPNAFEDIENMPKGWW